MARDECWYCGGKLIWQNDYDLNGIDEDREGLYTELLCSECGAVVTYTLEEEER